MNKSFAQETTVAFYFYLQSLTKQSDLSQGANMDSG